MKLADEDIAEWETNGIEEWTIRVEINLPRGRSENIFY